MQDLMLWEWLAVAAIGLMTAALAFAALSPRPDRRGAPVLADEAVWLFDGADLIEASAAAERAMAGPVNDWAEFRAGLAARFPDLPDDPADLRRTGSLTVAATGPGPAMTLGCEWIGGVVRARLQPGPDTADPADTCELDRLRAVVEDAPHPIWWTDRTGRVAWHNAAYARLFTGVHGRDPDPDTTLFDNSGDDRRESGTRHSVPVRGTGRKLWFDLFEIERGDGALNYATDVNAVVEAELAQRNFVQTLAKTFAQLSIGLAIFDRNRQLVLFNPALVDLTGLPAEFLSPRPTLLSFFDRLRDNRMMPEPKNYGSWRHQLADLVAAASDGRYQETWSLPSGSVYSVTGRPHPDGAVAFLFEDITAEVTLTRRFRSDLELGQSILDRLDDAIAVFATDGNLTLSNAAYGRLWKADPDKSFAQTSILDATRLWQSLCEATPAWGDLRDFVASSENRAEWWAPVTMHDGTKLTCSVYPVPGGATMVSFRVSEVAARAPELSDQLDTVPASAMT